MRTEQRNRFLVAVANTARRSLLLNEKSRVWCIPSLEIIADDVSCTHGATVSDLSEEEVRVCEERSDELRERGNGVLALQRRYFRA